MSDHMSILSVPLYRHGRERLLGVGVPSPYSPGRPLEFLVYPQVFESAVLRR